MGAHLPVIVCRTGGLIALYHQSQSWRQDSAGGVVWGLPRNASFVDDVP